MNVKSTIDINFVDAVKSSRDEWKQIFLNRGNKELLSFVSARPIQYKSFKFSVFKM